MQFAAPAAYTLSTILFPPFPSWLNARQNGMLGLVKPIAPTSEPCSVEIWLAKLRARITARKRRATQPFRPTMTTAMRLPKVTL
jgi:hypothetical protein